MQQLRELLDDHLEDLKEGGQLGSGKAPTVRRARNNEGVVGRMTEERKQGELEKPKEEKGQEEELTEHERAEGNRESSESSD